MTPDLAVAFQATALDGALISEVSPGSPAAHAGLERGDVIVAVGAKEVADSGSLRNAVSMLKPGTQTQFTVVRAGKLHKLSVTIGNLDAAPQGGSARAAKLGLELAPLGKEQATKLKRKAGEGVLVSAVRRDSAAAEAGLRPGQVIVSVNRKRVDGVEAFHHELAEAKEGGKILLRVHDGRHARYVVLHLR